jgi:hypothetical protein
MSTITLPTPAVALGAGFLLAAPLGTALPVNTVAGSIFTDAWTGFRVLGATASGHVFTFTPKTSPVDAAEYYFPVQYETDGYEGMIVMELLSITATNDKLAFNGGTTTVTGTGATTLSVYTPPDPGSEQRVILGWESRDQTERYVWPQVFQTGAVAIKRNRGGANKASLPLQFQLELPASGQKTFYHPLAGTARA